MSAHTQVPKVFAPTAWERKKIKQLLLHMGFECPHPSWYPHQ